MTVLKLLWAILTRAERTQMILMLVATVAGSVWEALALAAIVPFVGLLNNPQALGQSRWAALIASPQTLADPSRVLLLMAAGIFVFFLLKNLYLTALTYYQFRFVYHAQASLSSRLLRSYLRAPWTYHLERNSAELLRDVNGEVSLVFGNILNPLVVMTTEILVTLAILVLLLSFDFTSSVVALALLGGSSLLFFRIVRRKVDRLGLEQQQTRGEMIKCVNQGLGAIKETKVLSAESYFVDLFAIQSARFATAMGYLATVSQLPRFLIETVIVGAILIVLALVLWRGGDSQNAFSMLALCGVAGFRLMPAVNRIVSSVANIRYHRSALERVHTGLHTAAQHGADATTTMSPARLQHSLELRGVSFRYPGAHGHALVDLNLTVRHGESIGVTGPSGAGKTTLVDIIVGLLTPEAGAIFLDGVDVSRDPSRLRHSVGYIPQQVYLLDDSVRRNVAFGMSDAEIDDVRVWNALRAAQLEHRVQQLPEMLGASVGEDGLRFSGGERQRLGIARALYHDPGVLVLDEATASLDSTTEREVSAAIQALKGAKTLVIITHRLETIKRCDATYELREGRLHRSSAQPLTAAAPARI